MNLRALTIYYVDVSYSQNSLRVVWSTCNPEEKTLCTLEVQVNTVLLIVFPIKTMVLLQI